MTDCPDCTSATTQPWHGFRHGCQGCAARAVSRGINFASSRARGQQTRLYREELQLLGVTHADVLQAARVDAVNKEAA